MSVSVSAQPEFEELIEVEVLSGDTLWSIASKHTEGMSILSYITILKRENNLTSDHIYPGQILLVPQLKRKEEFVRNEGDYLLSSKY
ncbi:LysM peptidoglycan-binding domain-containing protein [Anaerobacillus alkaliphilus]|uniref:LysM peptidoglycan-binding domain-containing protein n=2 Tax=Anaerobacillus alkaliphilus TaxID=1548597 RepID=A0A4Q0VR57_9BACI|nr:LysM peptidoglycan-binding domain-containing protein [Anaerobacillus alkaliphilus]